MDRSTRRLLLSSRRPSANSSKSSSTTATSTSLSIVTLNNPTALHALTEDMIEAFQSLFDDSNADTTSAITTNNNAVMKNNNNNINRILIKANSDQVKRPTFCAGGDVKSIYKNGLSSLTTTTTPNSSTPPRPVEQFFRKEYKLNHTIAKSTIPIVSFWDGIVMGGGIGISLHGSYRVATENTIWSMPENAIGLFPDVGVMYWFNNHIGCHNLSRSITKYLLLTGARIRSDDLLYTGIATHHVPSNKLSQLEDALVNNNNSLLLDDDDDNEAATTSTTTTLGTDIAFYAVLSSFHEEPIPTTNNCFLSRNRERIERIFEPDTMEEIVSNLHNEQQQSTSTDNDDNFATETLETIRKLSPTSLKLTLEALNRGDRTSTRNNRHYPSIKEHLQMEYKLATTLVRNTKSDFYEGVRSVLIEKDFKPKWHPATLEAVTDERIRDIFDHHDEDELIL